MSFQHPVTNSKFKMSSPWSVFYNYQKTSHQFTRSSFCQKKVHLFAQCDLHCTSVIQPWAILIPTSTPSSIHKKLGFPNSSATAPKVRRLQLSLIPSQKRSQKNRIARVGKFSMVFFFFLILNVFPRGFFLNF